MRRQQHGDPFEFWVLGQTSNFGVDMDRHGAFGT